MALSIKHPEADLLARQLASLTGESLTETVLAALRERLRRVVGRVSAPSLEEELRAIGERCSRLPVLDPRSDEEILGYDEVGLPG
ncbi:MAG TPA: type II toxin-antitoxin system VapB family antitoxin [Thermoanaerobaculia bacterium]|nr:type II toxin-antitoxin system VapB family antitoxin [Thermoanaerobaculia bacterium]